MGSRAGGPWASARHRPDPVAPGSTHACALRNRLIGGDSPTHGELLSYLFFDPVFLRELAELGAADARRTLADAPAGDPWRFGIPDERPHASAV